MLVCVPNNAGYNLPSLLLKFSHMQAEVTCNWRTVELIPDIYIHKLKSSWYNDVTFFLFMFRCQVDINSFILSLSRAFFCFIPSIFIYFLELSPITYLTTPLEISTDELSSFKGDMRPCSLKCCLQAIFTVFAVEIHPHASKSNEIHN